MNISTWGQPHVLASSGWLNPLKVEGFGTLAPHPLASGGSARLSSPSAPDRPGRPAYAYRPRPGIDRGGKNTDPAGSDSNHRPWRSSRTRQALRTPPLGKVSDRFGCVHAFREMPRCWFCGCLGCSSHVYRYPSRPFTMGERCNIREDES